MAINISLPEERLLSGKGQANALEPITLDVIDNDLQRWKTKARHIIQSGGRFTDEEVHQILAHRILDLA